MPTGGAARRDTQNQIASKRRRAEARRCPKCGRGAAMQTNTFDLGDLLILARRCRWCGYEQSSTYTFPATDKEGSG